jgi:hypothetical protein
MKHSAYFHVKIERSKCSWVSSTFQFVEHVAFYRTIDVENSIFEFFVSPDLIDVFLHTIDALTKISVVEWCKLLPNRLAIESL